jgi:protein-tyrosine phosphatase
MVPIISHPERNLNLRKRIDDLARWVQSGCYVQVTALSYTGLFGGAAKSFAHKLLERGLTHFIASDAHDTVRRTTSLQEAYASLADRWSEELIRPLFVENPQAVLTGGTIDFEFPAHAPRARKWYQFFR